MCIGEVDHWVLQSGQWSGGSKSTIRREEAKIVGQKAYQCCGTDVYL
jgi:hypothetical protein